MKRSKDMKGKLSLVEINIGQVYFYRRYSNELRD